jgi:hypothetical protein
MFIEFSNSMVDLNSIESVSVVYEDNHDTAACLSMIGKSGTVYKEKYYINNDPTEEKILDERWCILKKTLLDLNGVDMTPGDDDIPF